MVKFHDNEKIDSLRSKRDLFQHECWTASFFKLIQQHNELEPLKVELAMDVISIHSTTENERLFGDVSKIWKSGCEKGFNFENASEIILIKR